jgi:quercetin dioxygenase-like cupin family protein
MKRPLRHALLVAALVSQAAIADSEAMIIVVSSSTRSVTLGTAEKFTGQVKVEQLFAADRGRRLSGGSVTFKPGARSAWHSHPAGQILIVTAGIGRIQQWGRAIQIIKAGDVVWIPPGIKHWHGAAPKTSMTHIALQEAVDGKAVDWMEHVSDAQYLAPEAKDP